MKILHVCKDEKFIDFFYHKIQQKTHVDNKFVICLKAEYDSCVYIKKTPAFRVVDDSYFNSKDMITDIGSADVIVIHYLTDSAIRLMEAASENVKIVWSGWGGDYYSLIKSDSNLLGCETYKIQTRIDYLFGFKTLFRTFKRNRSIKRVISKVDFFSAPIPQDFQLLKKALGNKFKAEYLQLNYASLEDTYLIGSVNMNRNTVLVGNSADRTNNHIEAFKLLAQSNYKNCKIIVPLSYGNNSYRNYILAAGHEILGNSFYPITKYLALDEYNKIISSCEIVVMNHMRQQAIGNIGCVLASGSKLYLNKTNPLYDFLVELGAHVYELDELKLSQTSKEKIASIYARRKVNQTALKSFWSNDVVSKNIDNFITRLES